MPCQTPWRDDSAQVLLFKIASCIQAGGGGGGGAGVVSFNGRTGVVTLTSGDVTTALGFTPISQADGDSRYVLKAGDTMTGSLNIFNSAVLVASDPALDITQTWNNAAVTFTGLQSNITDTASVAGSFLFDFQQNSISKFHLTNAGTARFIRQDQTDTAFQLFLRKRGDAVSATNAIASGGGLGSLFFSGWNGAAYVQPASVRAIANEVFTGIANGTRLDLFVTPVGSTTSIVGLSILPTGAAALTDGTAPLPSLTFQSDPDTGIYRIGANNFGLSAGGVLTLAVATTGVNLTTALAYQYNSVNVIRAQTALTNYWFANSGNLTGSGTSNLGFGNAVLSVVTTGSNNSGFGTSALANITTGSSNVGVGNNAVMATTGAFNTGIGTSVLPNITSGNTNTVIGAVSGGGITTGSNNTIVGASVGGLAAGLSSNIILATGLGVIQLQIDNFAQAVFSGTVATADGTAALPAKTFSADTNTGLYRIGADSIGTSTGGTLRITTDTTDQILATAFRLAFASGANTRAGNAVLVAGTVTVANTSVTANTIVIVTRKTSGGTIGFAVTYTVIAATSFTLTSDSALDTSTYSYILIENP